MHAYYWRYSADIRTIMRCIVSEWLNTQGRRQVWSVINFFGTSAQPRSNISKLCTQIVVSHFFVRCILSFTCGYIYLEVNWNKIDDILGQHRNYPTMRCNKRCCCYIFMQVANIQVKKCGHIIHTHMDLLVD